MKMHRRKALQCITAGVTIPTAILASSCKEGKGQNIKSGKPGSHNSDIISKKDGWIKKSLGFNMVDRINLAVLMCQGVFIDFGTSDHFKYTLGRWRSGWGKCLFKEGISFTQAIGSSSRIFFPWSGKTGATIYMRIAPRNAKFASLYVNNKPVSKIDFLNQDWNTYNVQIAPAMLTEGENSVLIRWMGEQDLSETTEAAWVDYVYIQDGGKNNTQPIKTPPILPSQNSIAGKTEFKKEGMVPALFLYPNTSLSYYLTIPDDKEEPELGFYLKFSSTPTKNSTSTAQQGKLENSNYRLTISIRTDSEPQTVLLDEKISPSDLDSFVPLGVMLTNFAGKIAKIDIKFSSDLNHQNNSEKLILAKPGLYVSGKNYVQAPEIIRGKNRVVAKNAILLMIDTLRADFNTCYGAKNMKTPVLDKLASEGVMFENFCAVEDWTKPSCATMLTGLYPVTHKTQTENVVLPKNVRMISEEIKARGIQTAAFIANGYISEKFGFKRGWDYYENYIREGKPTEAENVYGKVTEWIEKNKDSRFFAYVHIIDPHVPYDPPEDFLRLYDPAPYSGPIKPRMTHIQLEEIKKGKMDVTDRDKERLVSLYKGEISYHDKYLGWFMQKLADMGMLEDTIIIATADHGEEFWEHGSVGHGHSIYQELVHIPLVVYWKGKLEPGSKVSENYDHTIIAPTIMDALGLDFPNYFEGKSVLPRIFGQHNEYPHAGLTNHQSERMGVWSGKIKLQMHGPLKTFLYDLEKDPMCMTNLQKSHQITLFYMKSLLGLFMGAPDKKEWKSSTLSKENVGDIQVEEVQWDESLKKQLQILGYVAQ